MSKLKIRKRGKLFANEYGIIERSGNWHWVNRENIKRITNFDCERNSLYIDSILYYEQLPFSIHKLWVEIVDANTSRLMVKWNKLNYQILNDLSPFWIIYDSLAFERGINKFQYSYATLEEAMDFLRNEEIKNRYPRKHREKYSEYRDKTKEQRQLYWSLKKDKK